jgi:tetratricopeptide (TPR) repeat protein
MQLPKELNMLLYSILKTEADLLVDLQQYDLGIKAYKTLKDFCDDDKWGMLDLKMMAYESIAVCYRTCAKNKVAKCYFKKALQIAYFIKDQVAECRLYERLAVTYMNLGDTNKMASYHERSYNGLTEPLDGKDMKLAKANLKTKAWKKLKKGKYFGNCQSIRSGINVEDIDKLEYLDFYNYDAPIQKKQPLTKI